MIHKILSLNESIDEKPVLLSWSLITLFSLLLNGCYLLSPTVTIDDATRNLSQVVYSDGVDNGEMLIIAQHYLLTTADEPCKSAVARLDIGSPYTCGGWIDEDKKYGKYICFDWKGMKMFSNPMFVKVNGQSGETKCFGQHVVK